MSDPVIDLQTGRTFGNWVDTHGVGGPVKRLWTPRNAWSDGSSTPGKPWAPGLAGLQKIVQQCEADGTRVRAVGSSWSLSNCAYVEDDLVDTARLTQWFIGFHTLSMIEPAMQARAGRLVFAQCGTQTRQLNTYLEQQGLALPTSAASNGQTIAGAISTSTHGAAVQVGGMHDLVLGLHLVGEGGKHVWVERASKPVMSAQFAAWLGADLVRDDELFLAALVGFGSFGLIHAVMFEATPLYLLDRWVQKYDHSEVMKAATTLDVSGLALPWGNTLPWHFEIVFNPFRRGAGQKGARVRALQSKPATNPLPPPEIPADGALLGQDLVAIAGAFSDAVPAAIPLLMDSQLDKLVTVTAPQLKTGTPGMQFGDNAAEHNITSIELGVALADVAKTLQLLFGVFDANPFGAVVSCRYVKSSDAFLALNRFAPTTCAIEMPGLDSEKARAAHPKIFAALAGAGIAATYHWGQAAPFTEASVRLGFGDANVDRWLAARRKFLSPKGRKMFSNALLDGCGLSQ